MALLGFISVQLLRLAYVLTFFFVVYSVLNNLTWSICVSIAALFTCAKFIGRKSTGTIVANCQGILITGCDTGFGHDIARRLDELGFTVFAGCLHPEGDGAQKLKSSSSRSLHVVPLDVGIDESVQAAHEYVIKNLPRSGLWAIINNAGFGVMGDVEWLTAELFNKCMNVNCYGAIRTIRTFLHLVRDTKGRVVNVSSVKGAFPWPGYSAYHASKSALECMSDSLRLEMQRFGVKVAKIRPGMFGNATGTRLPNNYKRYRFEAEEMWKSLSDDIRSTYGTEYLTSKIKANEASPTDTGSLTSKPVIDAMVHAIMSDQPHTLYQVDGLGKNWFDHHTTLARCYGYLPTCVSDWIITKLTNYDRPLDKCGMKTD